MPVQKNPLPGKIPIIIAGVLCSCNLLAACPLAPNIFENLYQYDYDFAFRDPAQLITPFSADLNKLLKQEFLCKQAGYSCKIDWNPWTNAQDGEIINLPKIEKIEKIKIPYALQPI